MSGGGSATDGRRAGPSGARPRLAIVLPSHWAAFRGGAQYQANLLAEHLASSYSVDVRYLTVRSDPAFVPERYAIEQITSPRSLHRYGYFVDALPLYRALVRFGPDIVYQQIGCAHTGIAACYARRHGARMFWRVSSDKSMAPVRTPPWRLDRKLERAFLDYGIRRADVILAQTEQQKEQLARRHGRQDAVVLPSFHPSPSERIVKDARQKTVLWVANMKRVKNPLAFVRLAERFRTQPEVRFVMIGAMMAHGRLRDELSAAIAAAPNVRFLGPRSQDDVNAALASGHVLVNTSDVEGFSNVFIQAWMRRVPVVSLRVDPDMLLQAGGLGLLSATEEQLYRDVKRLLGDAPLCDSIGERCRRYALRRHSMANVDELARLMGLAPLAPESRARADDAALPVEREKAVNV